MLSYEAAKWLFIESRVQALGCGRRHTFPSRLVSLLLLRQALSSSGLHGFLEEAQYEYVSEPGVGRHLQTNLMAQYIVRSNTSHLPALEAIDAGCGRMIATWAASKGPNDNLTAYKLYLQARLVLRGLLRTQLCSNTLRRAKT